MGNITTIFNKIIKFTNLEKKFLNYNIIDKEYKIIIGNYSTFDESNKSNTMINQGICIGFNNDKIYKIKFGIKHKYHNIVELYLENKIKLVFFHEDKDKIKMELSYDENKIEKYIDTKLFEEYKLFDNNSEYINLIHYFKYI